MQLESGVRSLLTPSATIRSEITKSNVTNALGYAPTYELISDLEPTSDFWMQPY